MVGEEFECHGVEMIGRKTRTFVQIRTESRKENEKQWTLQETKSCVDVGKSKVNFIKE